MPHRLTDQQREERRAFLEGRQRGIGGSDMPAILGLVKGRNALDVYYEKTRPITDDQIDDDTIHQLRGHSFEGMALAFYWQQTGRVGRKTAGVTTHPDYPAMRVSRDFEIFADDSRPEGMRGTGTGETKAPVSSIFRRIIENGLRESEIVQLQTNIAVSRHEWGSLNYFNMEDKDGPTRVVDLPGDPELGQFLLEHGQRFWDEHVVPRIPPVPGEWSKLMQASDAPQIADLSGEVFNVPADYFELRELLQRELDLKDLMKEAEETYRKAQAELQEYVIKKVGHKSSLASGIGRVTVVTLKGRERFLTDTLRNAMPLDRDKVERWLREWREEDGQEVDLTLEAIGAMLFECVLDLGQFTTTGDPSQYIRTTRSNDVD